MLPNFLPKPIWLLFFLYTVASAGHFAHNAEYIAFYPGLPQWMTRESVYLAWVPVGILGVLGITAVRFGWKALGAALLAAYGLIGTAGLLHYKLALCSEHTLASNLTIWAEVVLGVSLAMVSAVFCSRQLGRVGDDGGKNLGNGL